VENDGELRAAPDDLDRPAPAPSLPPSDDRSSLPRGPHPTVGPGTIRMPGWPGPLLAIAGALLGLGALSGLTLIDSGQLSVEDRSLVAWLAVLGGVLFIAGLTYTAVRQVRVRAFLPPERYRGPSVLLLLLLVFVITNLVALPFASDAAALLLGEGDLSLLGATVILVSTQAALLLVTWLFVVRPNALAGLPVPGPDTPAAVRSGLVWGIGGWFVATLVSAVVVLVLQAFGIEAAPQAAEQALSQIDPWLAVLALVIVAPIAEEVFFRGVVFNAWLREGGRRAAYVGSAVLFGVIHLNLVAFVPIVILGLILAWVYERSRNLVAPIVLHAVFNGINVAVFLLADAGVIQLPT
jgi:membrane protease YdiL (CAAX protease family)